MQSWKIIFLSLFAFPSSIFASSACMAPDQVIPFQNLILAPNCSVNATYSFGNFSQLFCFTNGTQSVGSIVWTYQGVPQPPGSLPIFLTTKSTFSGQFIDPVGQISILNNEPVQIVVSCVFSY